MSFYEIVGYFAACAIMGNLIRWVICAILDRFSKTKISVINIKIRQSWVSKPFTYNCRANGTPYRNIYAND